MLLGGDHPSHPLDVSRSGGPPPAVVGGPTVPASAGSWWTRGHVPGEVGVWVFILGDMLAFGLFFGVFMVERGQAPVEFREGRESLATTFGALNTLLLLTGSLLVVLAMRAIRHGPADRAPVLLVGAIATGAVFVINKGIEYGDKFSAGVGPGSSDFYLLFFAFTGIHLLHLLLGLGALAYMLRLARRPRRSRDDPAMESCASYWHLVDLLWVVLFPLFYLVA